MRSHPLLLRFLFFAVFPALLLVILGYLYFRTSLPILDGSVAVPGVNNPATLTRDKNGVLYIKAQSEHDVYFATGYAHAQDRMWQLELQRRIIQGRLSEVFGRRSVKQDIWFRTLDLNTAAESAFAALSQPARASLVAYSEGVNSWIESNPQLPPEFVIFGIRPEKWKAVDSLAILKLLALTLGGNYRSEIERFIGAQVLEPSMQKAIDVGYPSSGPVTVQSPLGGVHQAKLLSSLLDLHVATEQSLSIGGRYVGSNAWVVSGRLSKDGRAILANDPHLSLQIPSLWYAVRQRGGMLDATGMGLVGSPVIIFGKNRHIAWGGTNMMADVQDLYYEQINTHDTSLYLSGRKWEKIVSRTEEIHVRADFPASFRLPLEPVRIKVRSTRHGPIISDAVDVFEQAVSLRWTGFDNGDTTYESLFRLSYATDWDSFRAALKFQVAPALNMLYIDSKNNIGYLGAGRIPIRSRGLGTLPVPGWTDEYYWKGYIPAEDMPRSFNPEAGYIISANNKVAGPEYPYFISNDWAPPARSERILQMLEDRRRANLPLTIDDMQQMQMDVVNVEAIKMLPLLVATQASNSREREALQYLKGWDGKMASSSQAATIYSVWMEQLKKELFANSSRSDWNKKAQQPFLDLIVESTRVEAVFDALSNPGNPWCSLSHQSSKCAAARSKSLNLAINELTKLAGSNMSEWRWGKIHKIHFKHMPFDDEKILELFFSREQPSGGALATVNTANATFQGSKGYVQNFGAAFRQIIQMDENRHWFIGSTGQAGHPLSPHYADMTGRYGRGEYVKFQPDSVKAEDAVLTISPPSKTQNK